MSDKTKANLTGLLNRTPVEPREQWRIAARGNSIRDMILEVCAMSMVEQAEKEGAEQSYDIALQIVQSKQKEIEEKYLIAMYKKREDTIIKKSKSARYRRYDK